jgi:hypothetical protein
MSDTAPRRTFRVTLYREDSVTTVVYDRVKHTFWTAGNTVLVIAQYADDGSERHSYIHWLREHLCWFKVEREGVEPGQLQWNEDEELAGLPTPGGNGHGSPARPPSR